MLGEARSLIGSGRYKVVHVDLTGEAAEDEGMVCGGIMDVLVEDFATDREPCDPVRKPKHPAYLDKKFQINEK